MATLVTPDGTTDIPDAVLEKIGKLALLDVPGISSSPNPTAKTFDRIRNLVGKREEHDSPKVSVTSKDSEVTVHIELSTVFPYPPYGVAMDAGCSVLEAIEYTTGLPAIAVEVHVVSATDASNCEIYSPKHGSQTETPHLSRRVNISYSQQVLDFYASNLAASLLGVSASDVKTKISDSANAISARITAPATHERVLEFARTRGSHTRALEHSLVEYATSLHTPLRLALAQHFGRGTNTVELKISTISGEPGGETAQDTAAFV